MECCIYQPRTYQQLSRTKGLNKYRVHIKESELLVSADHDIRDQAYCQLSKIRQALKDYIQCHPDFLDALEPIKVNDSAPGIVTRMALAAQNAGVGPMASVAGAISEELARSLHVPGHTIIVENGGDVYAFSEHPLTVALFAGQSPLSLKIGLEIRACDQGMSICTSSGTVGHSLNFGNADAVTVIARDGYLADAAATALSNYVQGKDDIDHVLDLARAFPGVIGTVIIIHDHIGMQGRGFRLCGM